MRVRFIDDRNVTRTTRISGEDVDSMRLGTPDRQGEIMAEILAWRHCRPTQHMDQSTILIDVLEPHDLAGSYSVRVSHTVRAVVAPNALASLSAAWRNGTHDKSRIPVHEALRTRDVAEEEMRTTIKVSRRNADRQQSMDAEQIAAMDAMVAHDMQHSIGKPRGSKPLARTEWEMQQEQAVSTAIAAAGIDDRARPARHPMTSEIGMLVDASRDMAQSQRASVSEIAGSYPFVVGDAAGVFLPIDRLDRTMELAAATTAEHVEDKPWWKRLLGIGTPIQHQTTRDYAYRMCAGHHELIEQALAERGIAASYSQGSTDWRLWRVPIDQVDRLPHENGEPYLGNEEQGFSLFDISDQDAEDIRKEGRHGNWINVSTPALKLG